MKQTCYKIQLIANIWISHSKQFACDMCMIIMKRESPIMCVRFLSFFYDTHSTLSLKVFLLLLWIFVFHSVFSVIKSEGVEALSFLYGYAECHIRVFKHLWQKGLVCMWVCVSLTKIYERVCEQLHYVAISIEWPQAQIERFFLFENRFIILYILVYFMS